MKKYKSILAIGLAVLAAFIGDFCAGLLREDELFAHAEPVVTANQPQDVLISNIKAHRDFFAKLGDKRELFTGSLADYANQKILGVTMLGKDRIGVAFLDDYGIQETVVFDTNSGKVLKRDSTILNRETRLAMQDAGYPVSDAYYLARQQPAQAQENLLVKEPVAKPVITAAPVVATSPVSAKPVVIAEKPAPKPVAEVKTSAMPDIEDFIYSATIDELVAHLKTETGWVSKVEREKQTEIVIQKSVTSVTVASEVEENSSLNSELVKKIVEHRDFFSKVYDPAYGYLLNPDKYMDYRVYNVNENMVENCLTVVFLSPTGEQEIVAFDKKNGKPLYRQLDPLSESSQRVMERNSIPIMDAQFLAQNIKEIRSASMTASTRRR